jgi:carbamoyltransferase
MRILGISAFYHDSAAALVRDGHIVAAAQEERFTRNKHDPGFPAHAVAYCLREEGVSLDDVDFIAFYDKPFLKFERLLETYLAFAPRGFRSFKMAIPVWLREKLFLKDLLIGELKAHGEREDLAQRLLFSEHHLSHAASAFFPSPFREAAVLTMDGVGEWATTSLAHGKDNSLEIHRIHRHSLGLLYFLYVLHRVQGQSGVQDGACALWCPRYAQTIYDNLIDPSGWDISPEPEYFNYCTD